MKNISFEYLFWVGEIFIYGLDCLMKSQSQTFSKIRTFILWDWMQ